MCSSWRGKGATLNEIEVLGTRFNGDSRTSIVICDSPRTGAPAVGALIGMLPEVVLVPTQESIWVWEEGVFGRICILVR